MTFSLLPLLLGLTLGSPTVDAGVYVAVQTPGYAVVGDPWSPYYAPPYRPGWMWVEGWYDEYGYWHPGYWVPVRSRPGYVWVHGYWNGPMYMEGYWRPVYRYGYTWYDGYYHSGRWIPGRWATYHHGVSHHSSRHDRWDDRYDRDRRDRYDHDRHDRYDRNPHYRSHQDVRSEQRPDSSRDRPDRSDEGRRGGDEGRRGGDEGRRGGDEGRRR
ncbi:MAG: hypothetical protein JXB39_04805 [Deltaproteobacteria bacterium]|nr:hypothetical protein [Deltaproteobacteria bacterium]